VFAVSTLAVVPRIGIQTLPSSIAFLQEDCIVNPNDFGYLLRFIIDVNGHYLSATCAISLNTPVLREIARHEAKWMTRRLAKERGYL
jgi:hypothetical protein